MKRTFHTTGRTFVGMSSVPDPVLPDIENLLTGNLHLKSTNINPSIGSSMYSIVWSWEYDRY